MNTHTIVVDIHQNLKTREDSNSQNRMVSGTRTFYIAISTYRCPDPKQVSCLDYQETQGLILASSIPGESPPPPPRAYFGRGELTEKIVGLVENLTPIALIGVGGIGKTSTALTVLHDDRIKRRFGEHRRFIHCDKFPASLPNFLHHLSAALGAGVENPKDLTPLRPFLSSREILIVLDNAESVLDPRGMDAQEIYAAVEELSQFDNICLCVTSRISIIPPACESFRIPTLSLEAARDAFYSIYKHSGWSEPVDDILEQLDFHPLSINLLATVAYHNQWSTDRLTKEWRKRRTGVLHTQHNKSLAATVELSLASPMFQELGPDARELLGVVAFFPHGVDENNIDWLFPTLPDRTSVFDTFCNLSLTYQSGGFVTMLAPLRDYLYPKDPKTFQLLCTTKDCYFNRLSVHINPNEPGFGETRWIMSEDVNVEHLLDVFVSTDTDPDGIWGVCFRFMHHLYWHKPRLIVLGPRIESLPDNHPSKPRCLLMLSLLFMSVGNDVESKRLLGHALKLWRERGDNVEVAHTLAVLSDGNRRLARYKEGISQAKEALEIYKRFCHRPGQGLSFQLLAHSLHGSNQLNAAHEAGSRALDLFSAEGNQLQISQCHRLLGNICQSKGELGAAVNHFETALRIASHINLHDLQFWSHHSLARLLIYEGKFIDACTHIKYSKSYAANNAYNLGRAMDVYAQILYRQGRLEEAMSEILCAAETFEKLEATQDLERCRKIRLRIQEEMDNSVATLEPDSDGELLESGAVYETYQLSVLR